MDQIARDIKVQVEDFIPLLPLLLALRNPGMRERHWLKIDKKLGLNLTPMINSKKFCLQARDSRNAWRGRDVI